MDNQYLIPANSKKSMLILGLFTELDLMILAVGVGITMIMVLFVPLDNLFLTLLALVPGMAASLLAMPFPNYRNVRTLLKEIYLFYNSRQKFIWKGWGVNNGNE